MSRDVITIQVSGAPIHVQDMGSDTLLNITPFIDMMNTLISERARGPADIDSVVSQLGEYSLDIMDLLNAAGYEFMPQAARLHQLIIILKTNMEKMKVAK